MKPSKTFCSFVLTGVLLGALVAPVARANRITTFASPAGLINPDALALSGNDLYVTNYGNNTVGEYNATTGAPITTFVNPVGLNEPDGLAILNVPELSTWAAVLGGGRVLLNIQRRRSASRG